MILLFRAMVCPQSAQRKRSMEATVQTQNRMYVEEGWSGKFADLIQLPIAR